MRIKISLSKSTSIVPFMYQNLMLGTIHKWFGANNKFHDKTSLYNYSWLKGFKPKDYGLIADKEPHFYFSAWEDSLIDNFVFGIAKDKTLFYGLEVTKIENIDYTIEDVYEPISPIFCKIRREDNSVQHLSYNNSKTQEIMTNLIRNKMKLAKLDCDFESIRFAEDNNAKMKLVTIHNIKTRANLCPVIIRGDNTAHNFILDVGVGHSTGSGFGCISYKK